MALFEASRASARTGATAAATASTVHGARRGVPRVAIWAQYKEVQGQYKEGQGQYRGSPGSYNGARINNISLGSRSGRGLIS